MNRNQLTFSKNKWLPRLTHLMDFSMPPRTGSILHLHPKKKENKKSCPNNFIPHSRYYVVQVQLSIGEKTH